MAKVPVEKEQEYKTIETANANQSYATQLTSLNAKFSGLSQAQKEKCIIVSGSAKYTAVNLNNGIFSRTTSNDVSFTVEYLRLDQKISYRHEVSKISGSSNNAAQIVTTNQTSTSNSNAMYLKMLS